MVLKLRSHRQKLTGQKLTTLTHEPGQKLTWVKLFGFLHELKWYGKLSIVFYEKLCSYSDQCFIELKTFNRPPDTWMVLSHKRVEPVLLPFTQVIGLVLIPWRGLAQIPQLWRKFRSLSEHGHPEWSTRGKNPNTTSKCLSLVKARLQFLQGRRSSSP